MNVIKVLAAAFAAIFIAWASWISSSVVGLSGTAVRLANLEARTQDRYRASEARTDFKEIVQLIRIETEARIESDRAAEARLARIETAIEGLLRAQTARLSNVAPAQ